MLYRNIRRPYITEGYEQDLFDNASKYSDNIEDDLKLEYSKIKEIKETEILSNRSWLSFCDILIKQCNDDLCCIANHGVYYLMVFISLGALSAKYGEKVDFVRIELKYILDHNLIGELKDRIHTMCYLDMMKDITVIRSYYEL